MSFSDPLTAGGMPRGDLVDRFAPLETSLSRMARRRGRRAAARISSRGAPFSRPPQAPPPHPDGGGPTGLENHSTQSLLDMLSSQHTAALAAATSGDAYERAQAKRHLDEVQAVIAQLPAQVGADYDKAIAGTAALGNASAQLLGAANPNAQVQADMAAIGAPSAQGQQVTNALQNAFQGAGAVMFQQGAVLPGTALESEKASQQAYYRGMGGVAQQQFADRMAALDQDLVQVKAKIEQDFNANLITEKQATDAQARADAAAATQAQQWQAEFGLRKQAAAQNARIINSQIGNRNFGQAATKVRLDQGQQRINQAQRSQLANIFGVDPVTGQPTFAARKAAAAAQRANAAAAKGKGASQATLARANALADTYYHGAAPHQRYDSNTGQYVPVPGTGAPPVGYQPALQRLLALGLTLAQATKILNAYYAPGEGGRPQKFPKPRLGPH